MEVEIGIIQSQDRKTLGATIGWKRQGKGFPKSFGGSMHGLTDSLILDSGLQNNFLFFQAPKIVAFCYGSHRKLIFHSLIYILEN